MQHGAEAHDELGAWIDCTAVVGSSHKAQLCQYFRAKAALVLWGLRGGLSPRVLSRVELYHEHEFQLLLHLLRKSVKVTVCVSV